MKKSILLFILVSLFTWSYAVNPVVTVNDAKQTATNFLAEQCHFNAASIQLTLQHTEMDENGEPLFYRFKLNNQGFVIVSASQNYYPILAFSYESDYESTEENVAFCESYKKNIHDAKSTQAPVNIEANSAWNYFNVKNFSPSKNALRECQPLLTSNWGQTKYYNQYCPYSKDAQASKDRRTVVGSAGLTMASIINYYRYPTQGYGGVSYISSNIWSETFPRIFLNLNEVTYDYDVMPSTISDYNGEIAKLLFHTGATAQSDYSAERFASSSIPTQRTLTEISDAVYALKQYWGFSNDAQLLFRPTEIQEDSVWIRQYIIPELDQRHPVFYSGYTDETQLKQVYMVIDGYKYMILPSRVLIYLHVNYTSSINSNSEMKKAFYLSENITPVYNTSIIRFLFPIATSIEKPITSEKQITSLSGSISDGAGSVQYASNSNRKWLLAAPNAAKYKFTFRRLNTEEGNDTIAIYAGETATPENLVSSFSGQYWTYFSRDGVVPSGSVSFDPSMTILPSPFTVTSDKVLVTFNSNDTIEDYGFVLEFAVDSLAEDIPACADATIKQYHYVLTDTTTTEDAPVNSIVSSNSSYKAQNVCTWTVQADSTADGLVPTQYVISFPKFDLKAGDFLEITQNITNNPDMFYIFDINNWPQNSSYIVDEGSMKIRFVSDHWQEGTGFEMEYWALGNTGINQASGLSDVRIYPNPATDYVNVNMTADAQRVDVNVLDMSGKVIYNDVINHAGGTQVYKISVSELSSGMYFMNLNTPTGRTIQKFVVK